MATRENVTAAQIDVCTFNTVKGSFKVPRLVRTLIIRESICSPYITAELLIVDNSNVIINMSLQGGDLCQVTFNALNGKSYTQDLYVLDVKAENSPENMDLRIYTISLDTSEYFTDQATRTPETTAMMQNGVSLAMKIWGEAGFKVPLVPRDSDAPLQDGDTPLTIGLMKPISAIGQIRNIQVYPAHPTGNVLLYRDVRVVNLVPLQLIYEQAAGGGTAFQQSQTWGIKYENMFIGGPADNAIISAINNSRATMLDPKQFKASRRGADDISAGKMNIGELQGVGASLGAAGFALMNSNKTSPPIDHTTIMDAARAYAHCVKAQPQYLVRVPIQSGINITVGTGVTLNFTPTTLDGKKQLINPDSGAYLVTDLIHEVHNDLREVLGTTSLQCLKAGGPCGV